MVFAVALPESATCTLEAGVAELGSAEPAAGEIVPEMEKVAGAPLVWNAPTSQFPALLVHRVGFGHVAPGQGPWL